MAFLETVTVSGANGQVSVVSASASSYDGIHVPNFAINGQDGPDYWGTNSVLRLPQWLQLDLGGQIGIGQVVTHFYDGDSRVYTYFIQVSADGSSWSTVVSSKTGSSIVTDTFNQVMARYVRITVTGNTANLAAHIEEVRVYSTGATQSPTKWSGFSGKCVCFFV